MIHEAESKEAAEALRVSEARFRATFQNAAVGMAIGDMSGRLMEANASLERMLGYPRDELRLMVFTEFTHPDDVDADLILFKELVAGKRRQYNLEKRYIRKDGAVVWGHLNVSLVRAANGEPEHVIAMVEDITERRAAEKALQQSEEKLRAAQKLEAIGRLAGGIAHDFNNLLTAILGYSGLVLQELDANDPLRADIEHIQRSGERAASLTRQLLAFGRGQVLRPEILDLNDAVANLSAELRRVVGANTKLTILPSPNLGHVEADPSQIQQLLLILIRNARDAMPEGGKLTIETANAEIDDGHVHSGVEVKPGVYSVIMVSDTGRGMDEETQSRALEPFFTTKQKGRGTGLGLSTAYGIVKQSGGYIWLYSEPEVGTTVEVYLPSSPNTSKTSKSGAHFRTRVDRTTETILVVEDEDSVRALAARILKAEGYTVLEASNGAEGLRRVEQHPERIDLILTDLVMPELGGPDMVKRLTPSPRGAKVLYMSGYTEAALFNRALEPHQPFLHKPFTAKSLIEKVREILDTPSEETNR